MASPRARISAGMRVGRPSTGLSRQRSCAASETWPRVAERARRLAPLTYVVYLVACTTAYLVPSSLGENIARLRGWGYELIKHDFSTYDITEAWGKRPAADIELDYDRFDRFIRRLPDGYGSAIGER